MDECINVNEIIAGVAEAEIDRLSNSLSSAAKRLQSMTKAQFPGIYRKYLCRLVARYSHGKSFLFGSEPVPLYDFFVPLDLQAESRAIKHAQLSDLVSASPRSVITGTGGCGKTVLMRHLLLGAVKVGTRVPVFVELRHLNDGEQELDLSVVILESLSQYGLDVDATFLEATLRSGRLCLLLDGFDEVAFSRRKAVVRAIERMATRYPKNWMILTSRPDTDLSALSDFVQYTISPLTLESAVELVDKLPFPAETKTRFIADLKRDLYRRHTSFLSNPLLLSIMLLTYQDAAHIPSKLNMFYAQAYEALFQRHDARKGAFTRERRTPLDMQDYAHVFSGFCIVTYDKRFFTFDKVTALDFIKRASSLASVPSQYRHEDFLDDCIQAVCLLVEDGMSISFAHRSFQEYFAARYIANAPVDVKQALIEKYMSGMGSDSVMDLLWEIDRDAVETYCILPSLKSLREAMGVKNRVGITHYLNGLRLIFEDFIASEIGGRRSFMITARGEDNCLGDLPYFLRDHYRSEFVDEAVGQDWDPEKVHQMILDAKGFAGEKVPTSQLRSTDELVIWMSQCCPLVTTSTFETMFKLGDSIVARHQRTSASIAELFD